MTPRGFVDPNLLATVLLDKYAQHLLLNRQSERFGREGIVSTLADVPQPRHSGRSTS